MVLYGQSRTRRYFNMDGIVTKYESGLTLIEPKVYRDDRGYFYETYNRDWFDKNVEFSSEFVQDNQSFSTYGVLRGLHFQAPPFAQAKLVRVVCGEVYDVGVDIRRGSPTFGKWEGVFLSDKNKRQFLLPRGFAHGFVVLSDHAIFQYKCDAPYCKECEGAIAWNDGDISVDWPIPVKDVILSEKDRCHPMLRDIVSPFVLGENC